MPIDDALLKQVQVTGITLAKLLNTDKNQHYQAKYGEIRHCLSRSQTTGVEALASRNSTHPPNLLARLPSDTITHILGTFFISSFNSKF